ncbi:MAG: TetR/AcrR family transcriptional regulator [Betaproteobacteria bacterium]|jgi:AcrR family transcriptional regulator|nr:TetR/AcrR family transcriptional regulator [Rhodocyclaceae bacterium]
MGIISRLTVRQQQNRVREEAILDATRAMLARKGYDLMTVDEVAAEAGIAKASLYKHFGSKESLAAAVMIRLLDQALAFIDGLPPEMPPADKMQGLLRWALDLRLEGGLPLLPSTSSTLQFNMLSNREYVKRILDMNARMTTLVAAAQAQGVIDPELPADVVVFALYARTCDPAVEYLRMTGHYTNQQVIDYLVRVAFAGLRGGR